MKVLLRTIWRWSWVLTLPIAVVFARWGWLTADRYFSYGVRYNPQPVAVRLYETGRMEFSHLVRQWQLACALDNKRNKDLEAGLKTINIFALESGLAKLNSNLPHSGFDYIEGVLLDGERLKKVKLKYRGDFVYHWGAYKKSLRIKTSKSELYEGMRSFNLIATKPLSTYLGYKLASLMGLIAPRSELVNVTINGQLMGVYTLVEQLEEMTLRNHGYMPGDLYGGELLAKDAWPGVSSFVFEHPGLWEKISVNNHYPEDSRKPLERLLSLLASPQTEEIHGKLSHLLDMESWGRLAAFETLTQSFHYDETHNWRIYYDPATGKMIPIVWDPNAWMPQWLPAPGKTAQLDIIPSRLHEVLMNNGDFIRARHKAIQTFFETGKDKIFLMEVAQMIKNLEPALNRDPHILVDYIGAPPGSIAKVIQATRKYHIDIVKVFEDVAKGYLHDDEEVRYAKSGDNREWELLVSGRKPVDLITLHFQDNLTAPHTAAISYWLNSREQRIDISGAVSTNGNKIDINVPLIARFDTIRVGNDPLRAQRKKIVPAYYRLTIEGLAPANRLIEVRVARGKDDIQEAQQVDTIERDPFDNMFFIAHPQPAEPLLVWEGTKEISGYTEVDRELVIKPGTTIRFGPGATLVVRNKLIAEGESDNPIRFLPQDEGQAPWGALIIDGDKARGTRLRYCQFRGGSGYKDDLREYSAMLSVHKVEDVAIRHCQFQDSQLVDDMVHGVYSEMEFSDCVFERARADALDLDICRAVVERCRFQESGNDGLDLMTTRVSVFDTLFMRNGDKGISVGEGSNLFAVNDRFTGNVIGVQAKDGSQASLYNVDLTKNGKALDAYKKNWRYNAGGEIHLYKSRIAGNEAGITADKKSRIFIYDSFVEPAQEASKRIKLGSVDSKSEMMAVQPGLGKEQGGPDLPEQYRTRVNTTRRGTYQTNLWK